MAPKRKIYEDFWESFEAKCAAAGLKSEVPASLKKLLNTIGYNSMWSFKNMTDEKLYEAEKYIEQYHRNIVDEFEEYKDAKPFKFLPGHKSLIFGITSEIAEMKDEKRPKKNMKSKFILSELELQASLLNQMFTYSNGLGLTKSWSDSIKDSSYTATETAAFCTCTLLCPICFSSFVVRYDKHWKNSNLCKHLRKHALPSAQHNVKVTETSTTGLSEKFNQPEKNFNIKLGSNLSLEDILITKGCDTLDDTYIEYDDEFIELGEFDTLVEGNENDITEDN